MFNYTISTGTVIVAGSSGNLTAGDVVGMSMDKIGLLKNSCKKLQGPSNIDVKYDRSILEKYR